MGDPRKSKKKYDRPKHPWDEERLNRERKIVILYGLKNKKELLVLEKILRNKRKNARALLSMTLEKRETREKELLGSVRTLGLLKGEGTVDDVLGLSLEEILERRLQTLVWRKNLAKTINQARQFIVHGHIAIADKKVTVPGYLVSPEEDGKLGYYGEPPELEPPKPEKASDLKADFEAAAGGLEEVTGAGFLKEREAQVKEKLAEAEAEASKAKAAPAGTAEGEQ